MREKNCYKSTSGFIEFKPGEDKEDALKSRAEIVKRSKIMTKRVREATEKYVAKAQEMEKMKKIMSQQDQRAIRVLERKEQAYNEELAANWLARKKRKEARDAEIDETDDKQEVKDILKTERKTNKRNSKEKDTTKIQ